LLACDEATGLLGCLFTEKRMSGVPSRFKGDAILGDSWVLLFTLKRMSGVPSRFTGGGTLPDEGIVAWGLLFTLKRMSGVPSFLTGPKLGVLSLRDFKLFWEDAWVTASLFTLNLLSGVPSFFNGRPP